MDSIPKDKSLYDFFVEKSEELFGDGKGEEGNKELLCQMSEMWGAYIGEPVQRQSLRFVWLEEVCGGGESLNLTRTSITHTDNRNQEELFVETNYKAILAAIAKPALEKAEIKLNTRVLGVHTTERETKGGKVSLTIDSGETLSFDEVIMTTPLGWLKKNKHVFSPSLPPRLTAGIDAISVGHLEKVRPLPSPHTKH